MTAQHLPLAGKVALVTGGAGGLGRAICQVLASEGARVIVGYHRSNDAARAVAAALPYQERGHMAAAAPVTDSPALASLAEHIAASAGRLDIRQGGKQRLEHLDQLRRQRDSLGLVSGAQGLLDAVGQRRQAASADIHGA